MTHRGVPLQGRRSVSTRRRALVPVERITQAIVVLRGQRVILDSDLAAIHGATTGRLNEAVKRNAERFPEDFMFQLTVEELENLRSQFAISSWGGRRYRPFAFTEHGAIQAAGKRGPTPLLQKQIERLNRLPKAQQKVVLRMLDGVLSQG